MLDVSEPQARTDAFDPILLSVLQSLMVSIMDECEINLSRTAFSPLIYEGKDYCIGLLDREGNTIVQSRGSVPTFVADLKEPIADGLEIYGPDGFEPGDAVIMNFSDVCGQHLNNVIVYVPVHWEGRLVGFVASRAHWTDVGGNSPGSAATNTTEIFQEGIQFRTLKVYKRGVPDPEILRIVRHNTRTPELTMGDMEAQIAAVQLGCTRYLELIGKYGWDIVERSIHAMWDQCEALARERIRALRDGTYEAEAFLDDDGIDTETTIPLKIRLIVSGDEITFDYSDCPPQTKGPMNSGIAVAASVAKVAFKSILVPNGPATEGSFRPLKVIVPSGTIISATNNAAMSLWTVSIKTILDLMYLAFSQCLPDAVPAGHHGSMGVYGFSGVDPRTGRKYYTADTVLGGWGAQPDSDGFSPLKTVTHGDTRQVPVEIEEMLYPLICERHEWRPDSAGPGRFRGGLGLRKVYRVPAGGRVIVAFERSKCPPWGLFGGGAAQVGKVFVRQPSDPEPRLYYKATNLVLEPGATVELLSGGGGGREPAYERDVARVEEDVRQGYVSLTGAREAYGVVITPGTFEADRPATDALREAMRFAARS
jgi:N-methylhydantoinase B